MSFEPEYYGKSEIYGDVNCSEEIEKKFKLAEEECYKSLRWVDMDGFNFKELYYNQKEEYLIMAFHDGAVTVHTPVTTIMYIHLITEVFPEEYYYTEFSRKTFHRNIVPHCSNGDRFKKLIKDTSAVWSAEEFVDIVSKEGYTYDEIRMASRNIFGIHVEMKYRLSYILYDMKTKECIKWTISEVNIKEGYILLSKDSPLIKEIQRKDVGDVIAGRYILIRGGL